MHEIFRVSNVDIVISYLYLYFLSLVFRFVFPGHVVSCSACPVWQFEVNRTHCLDTPLAIPPIPVIVDSLSIPIDPLSLRVFIRSSSAIPLVDLYEVFFFLLAES